VAQGVTNKKSDSTLKKQSTK